MNLKSNYFFYGHCLNIGNYTFFFEKIVKVASNIFMFHGDYRPFLNTVFRFFAKSRYLLGIFRVFLINPCKITT